MMKCNSKVVLNWIKIRQITNAAATALEKTTEAVHTDVVQSQVIPRDTGTLQNEGTFVDYSMSSQGRCTIVSSTPYARRLYFHPEYHFSTLENPNAMGEWYAPWLPGGEKENFSINAYKAFYRKESGI